MSGDHITQAFQSVEESTKQLKTTLSETLKEISRFTPQGRGPADSEAKLRDLRDKMYTLLDERLMDSKARFKARVNTIVQEFNHDLDSCADRARNLLEFRNQMVQANGEKVHVRQPTPISKLLYNKDWRTVYNIFFAFMVNIGIAEFVREITQAESYLFGWDVITINFANIPQAALLWLSVFMFSLTSVACVQLRRLGLPLVLVLLVHVGLLGSGVYYSCINAQQYSLPLASCIMFMCEALRMMLKMHSYVREKLLRDPSLAPQMPISSLWTECKHYIYFSFAPTLIYRDTYPVLQRNIRWSHAFIHVINFFATIFYTTILFKGFCLPAFASASQMRTIPAILKAWIVSTLPGTMVFLNVFFGVSHSFFSFFAEMLQFADRGFYGDWWNATDFTTFFSKVSLVMTDWVGTYIYIDSQRVSSLVRPWFARLLVFLFVSALCETVLSVSVGFLYPLPFVLLAGPGMCIVTAYTGRFALGNIVVWVALILMNGLMLMLYFLEYYAAQEGLVDMTEKYGVIGHFLPQLMNRLQY